MNINFEIDKNLLNQIAHNTAEIETLHPDQHYLSSVLLEHNGAETRLVSTCHRRIKISIVKHVGQEFIEPKRYLLNGFQLKHFISFYEENDLKLAPDKVIPTVIFSLNKSPDLVILQAFNQKQMFIPLQDDVHSYPDYRYLAPYFYNQEVGLGKSFTYPFKEEYEEEYEDVTSMTCVLELQFNS